MVFYGVLLASMPAAEPFCFEIVDRENGWPVPLVELRTTHEATFCSDNFGLVAISAPELFDREVYFHVQSHGYEVKPDGFGYRGVRVRPTAGGRRRLEVDRSMVAKRLGRLTGAGRYAEAMALGQAAPLSETGVFGCDSVQLVRHRGRLLWFWGDTTLPHYPLGIFHMTGASTPLRPLDRFEPPVAVDFQYFRDAEQSVRAVATFPGPGPTWLGGLFSLPAADGTDRLVASYAKIRNFLEEYESGLCVWDDGKEAFAVEKVMWRAGETPKPSMPLGHPFLWKDDGGREWLLYGDPFPVLRMPATFSAWQTPATWERFPAAAAPQAADGSGPVEPHRGSVVWNPHRQRWITVFTQMNGKPSTVGELWYAESASPLGPWGPAVKVVTHQNYTFYNPRIHAELVPDGANFIVFEGTYTAEFADRPRPTPRYNYNQILYRLDLDDPALKPTRAGAVSK